MGWGATFYGSSIGKKITVAVTGLLLLTFLVGHMLGNLQVFAGRGPTVESTQLNEYARLLRTEMGLLWALRLGLLVMLVLHVITVISLSRQNRRARSASSAGGRRYRQANVFSRSMLWGGIAIFAYAVYHILHFTAGLAHPDLFEHGDVYGNVVRSFQRPAIAIPYLVATIALYLHLHHGAASVVQTLGVSHPRYRALLQDGGRVLALGIAVGFASVPFAVLVGIVT